MHDHESPNHPILSQTVTASSRLLDLEKEVADLLAGVKAVLSLADAAEDEIISAQWRHGESAPVRDAAGKVISETGILWNSFHLLRPTDPMQNRAEFVYRAHCRELLDRVARGQDTRPATDAELILVLSQASLQAPLHGPATGLDLRLFSRCFPQQVKEAFGEMGRTVEDYERMYADQINDHETLLRRKVRQDWRVPRPQNAAEAA